MVKPFFYNFFFYKWKWTIWFHNLKISILVDKNNVRHLVGMILKKPKQFHSKQQKLDYFLNFVLLLGLHRLEVTSGSVRIGSAVKPSLMKLSVYSVTGSSFTCSEDSCCASTSCLACCHSASLNICFRIPVGNIITCYSRTAPFSQNNGNNTVFVIYFSCFNKSKIYNNRCLFVYWWC